MAPPFATSSSSWRNPPAALQLKYNLTTLPDNFEPTAEEQELLEMYETIKQYEKEGARLKEEAARAKLKAAAAKYEDAELPASRKRKKKKDESKIIQWRIWIMKTTTTKEVTLMTMTKWINQFPWQNVEPPKLQN
jgi:hypothetical protein